MRCTQAIAVVTGAARRVGRAIALALADAGCDVAVHFNRSLTEAEETVDAVKRRGRRAMLLHGDLAAPATLQDLILLVHEGLGPPDILVNNASIFEPDPTGRLNVGHYRRMMQVNAIAPAALIRAAADDLAACGCGKVINLCDIAAERPWPGYAAYCASKAALVNLTLTAARELAPRVQVNGVSPGIAVFPEDYDAALREKLIAQVPLRRAGSPEDIAATVRFLVEHGDYITGQIIRVDGGRSIV